MCIYLKRHHTKNCAYHSNAVNVLKFSIIFGLSAISYYTKPEHHNLSCSSVGGRRPGVLGSCL